MNDDDDDRFVSPSDVAPRATDGPWTEALPSIGFAVGGRTYLVRVRYDPTGRSYMTRDADLCAVKAFTLHDAVGEICASIYEHVIAADGFVDPGAEHDRAIAAIEKVEREP